MYKKKPHEKRVVRNIIIKFKIQNSLEFLFISAIAVRSARGKSIFAHKIRCAARLTHCVVKPTQGGRKIVQPGIYLWQGDITALKCDSVVNAANSALLGCFYPNHECIDNAVHTFAGVELRLACSEIMRKKGHAEKPGCAEITPAFNLPCRYVIHTVGPVVSGEPTERDFELLRSCYLSCLKKADEYRLNSIAFCCISTGEFHFPNGKAAETAIEAVKSYKAETQSKIKVIFNVFKDKDLEIYRRLLG